MNSQEIEATGNALEGKTPQAILTWAAERFCPGLTFATGFGAEGCVIIDIISRISLRIDVFTLDTGLLFPQTYSLWKRLEERYGLTIRPVRPLLDVDSQALHHGPRLWERNPDKCCEMRKLEPLRTELKSFNAWITAIRRDQTRERSQAQIVEQDQRFGLVKINPLAAWSISQVWEHILNYQVPYNPLHDQSYPSIGCQPCTSPVLPGEDQRSGRWRGHDKRECGLHVGRQRLQ